MKEQANKVYNEYVTEVKTHTSKLKEVTEFVNNKIKSSGLYEEPPEPKELVSTVKFTIPEDRVHTTASAVQIQLLPGTPDLIGMKTYAQIVDGCYEVIRPEYKRMTDDARKKQRLSVKDSKVYLDNLIEYLTNTEVLTIEGQKAIATKVGITSKKLEESEIALMERGMAQNIMIIQSSLRARIKYHPFLLSLESPSNLIKMFPWKKLKKLLNIKLT